MAPSDADESGGRLPVTVRCAWCGASKTSDGWVSGSHEERLLKVRPTDTICPACREEITHRNGAE